MLRIGAEESFSTRAPLAPIGWPSATAHTWMDRDHWHREGLIDLEEPMSLESQATWPTASAGVIIHELLRESHVLRCRARRVL